MIKNEITYKSGKSTKWFLIIGLISTFVHYVVAVGFDTLTGLPAEQSNLLGFIFAFPISYLGHRNLSFAHQKSRHVTSLPRFLFVSIAGIASNQAMLVLFVKFTALPFWLSLALVIAIVAISSYFLSRYWAFN